jgi:rod shape-determining protein MreB
MSIYYFDIGSTMVRVMHGGVVVWQEPSCIAIHRTSDAVLAVGTKAYRLLGKTTAQIRVIFPVQFGVIADERAYQQLLLAVTKSFSTPLSLWDKLLGVRGTFAHLSSVTPQEKRIVKQSLRRVGLRRLQLLDQTVSAAAFLQLVDSGGKSFCIIDIGGQVSEVAIITGHEVVAVKRLRWGGVQCTELIQEAIMRKHEAAVSWHTAEQVKKELGVVSSNGKVKQHKLSIRGKSALTQLGKTMVVSSEEISPVCTKFAQEIVKAVQLVFSQAPAEVVTSCLDQGIFIVGGGAALQGLAGYLQDQLSAEVCVPNEPETVVLRGLAQVR